MKEILPIHNLEIYIDNVFCDPTEDVSCPRSITVSYVSQVITLINHNLIGAAQLEVTLCIYDCQYFIVFFCKITKIDYFIVYFYIWCNYSFVGTEKWRKFEPTLFSTRC